MMRYPVHRRTVLGSAVVLLAWWLSVACAQPPPSREPAAQANITPTDRPRAVRVVDPTGVPVVGALVYADTCSGPDGACAPLVTDQQGQVVLDPSSDVVDPIALALQVSKRAGEDTTCCQNGRDVPCRSSRGSWSYDVYLTNLTWAGEGDPSSMLRVQEGVIELQLQRLHPLILFNLTVALDWPASDEYLGTLVAALHSASDYLFDLTDGQMALGQVAVYDNSQNWAAADLRVHRSNTVCPFATIGVLTGLASAGAIELSPYWDGDYVTGPWTEPSAYRTIAHEFLHYAAGLYDEYVDDAGNSVYCPYPKEQLCAGPDKLSASAMFHEECATELSAQGVAGLWEQPACTNTRQWQRTQLSAWEAVERAYGDSCHAPPRWRIETPLERGAPMAGPDPSAGQWPAALPHWPAVTVYRQPVPVMPDLWVDFTSQCTASKVNVALYPGGHGPSQSLGEASLRQPYLILGARPGDGLCVETQGSACTGIYQLAQADWSTPPTIDVSGAGCDTDTFVVAAAAPSWTEQVNALAAPPASTLTPESTLPGEITVAAVGVEGMSPVLSYNLATGAQGMVELLQNELPPSDLPVTSDYGQVVAVAPTTSVAAEMLGRPLGTYAVQQFGPDGSNEMFSADGRIRLTVGPGSPSQEDRTAVIYQPSQPPSPPLPNSVRPVSDVGYAAPAEAGHEAVLEARCIPRPSSTAPEAAGPRAAYKLLWLDEARGQWEAQDVEFVDAANVLTARISRPGFYVFVEVDE